MKTARLLAVAAATLASIPLMAQQVNASAQQSASGSVAGMHANQSADAGAQANLDRHHAATNTSAEGAANVEHHRGSADANASGYATDMARMRPVTGELQGNLDAKSAHVGQQVVLKTREKIKTADGTVIPRGSRLIGHVTEVQAHARGHEQSSLGIAFDRAELRNGQSFAIHSVIEAVRPSAAELDAASMANEDTFAGPAAAPVYAGGGAMGGGAMGVGRAGGGVLGGGAGAVGGASSAVGGLGQAGSGLASNAGGALNAGGNAIGATGNVAGNTAAHLGQGVYGSTGAMGSLGTHATAFPGVMLNSSAVGGASGTFTAAKRNVRFDSGTQMVVGLVAAH